MRFYFIFLKDLFEREHTQAEAVAQGEGEADSPMSREPEVGRAQFQDPGIMT